MTQQQDLLSPDNLRLTQRRHLHALEQWAGKQGKVCGVPVVRCLAYDLIQPINQMWLGWAIMETNKREAQQNVATEKESATV